MPASGNILMKSVALILLIPGLAACAPEAPDAQSVASSAAHSSATLLGRLSQYTPLTGCRVTTSKPDEAGYRVSDCPGFGGYGIQLVESDGRENLMIQPPEGPAQSLRLPEHGGGGFSDLGEHAEWRGDPGAAPQALIVRYKVVEKADAPESWTSYLFVVSLTGRPCVAAKVPPGAQQNDEARHIADGPMTCLAYG
jgi:hypothetical protein